ncbi:DapH/DapD/GlmU-related protein [Chloroflexota bacterium]
MPQQLQLSVHDLVNSTGVTCKILGTTDRHVSSISRIDEARSESVAFCNNKGGEGLQMVKDSNAGVIICYDDLQLTQDDFRDKTLILVSAPKLAFIRIMKAYFTEGAKSGISSGVFVDEKAKIHPSVYIGSNSYISNCEIGEGTIIHGSVHIYSGTRIGKNVLIQAGAVIGAEGQSYAVNERGDREKFPQIGGVIIQDDVEIGSNASIMRGPIGNTIIGNGTKVGHMCMIGHGVIIGKHCRIISMSMIAGSSRIGDYSQVKLGACIRNGITIGRNVLVGMGAVVTQNVSDGKIVFGVPAKEHNTFKL